jgi:hypothetical protein
MHRLRAGENDLSLAAFRIDVFIWAGRLKETALTRSYWQLHVASSGAVALGLIVVAATPARADFFDDVRHTFQTDVPHFFQDDIPCAFGGQPTSHTRTSCKSSGAPAKPAPKGASDRAATSPPKVNEPHDVPKDSRQ